MIMNMITMMKKIKKWADVNEQLYAKVNEDEKNKSLVIGRKTKKELHEMLRGLGFMPIEIYAEDVEGMQMVFRAGLKVSMTGLEMKWGGRVVENPFYILRTEVEEGRKKFLGVKNTQAKVEKLEEWLRSYRIWEIFDNEKGFIL